MLPPLALWFLMADFESSLVCGNRVLSAPCSGGGFTEGEGGFFLLLARPMTDSAVMSSVVGQEKVGT